jgi:hypothetical protein
MEAAFRGKARVGEMTNGFKEQKSRHRGTAING